MADEKIGLSDEQQAVLDADFQQQSLHQTAGQSYLRCYATNDLPAEARDAKFALAKIIDDLLNYELESNKRFRSGEIPLEKMGDVFAEIQIAKQRIADVSMWVTRIFTTHR
jgi:hypothetical protein